MRRKKNLRGNAGIKKSITNGNSLNDFDFDFNTGVEKIENEIKQITRPGKVLKCFICISCNKPRTQKQMSKMINVCRNCLTDARTKGKIAQSNLLSRLGNNLQKYFRMEVTR